MLEHVDECGVTSRSPSIIAKDVCHDYVFSQHRVPALRDVSFTVERGEFVALVGCNGSGKSTLARHVNALVPLQSGSLVVCDLDVSDETVVWEVRRHCGMVFQNPDNQFVSSIVEEDLSFGLDNFGVPRDEWDGRIDEALAAVDMEESRRRSPHKLSGGQKQRIALAGVLVLRPDIVILDEVTTMLPPEGRTEVLDIVRRLHEQGDTTIIMISHYIEEVVDADRVIVMQDGRIAAQGAPQAVLADRDLLRDAGLEPPFAVRLYHDLRERGVVMPEIPLTSEKAVELLCQL